MYNESGGGNNFAIKKTHTKSDKTTTKKTKTFVQVEIMMHIVAKMFAQKEKKKSCSLFVQKGLDKNPCQDCP